MFIVTLKFADKSKAATHMEAHSAWIQSGFDDGVFMLAGSLQPSVGGAVIAHGPSRDEIDQRIAQDPFVIHGVVHAEILEVALHRTDERFDFLKG